jgi:zinc and cadmium transporter
LNLLILIIIFTAVGGVLSVMAAAVFLLLRDHHRNAVLPHGISFAIGALLAVAFWGLIPEAFAEGIIGDNFSGYSRVFCVGKAVDLAPLSLW